MRKIKSLDDTLFFIQFKKHVEKLEKRFIDSCEEILNKEVKQWQNFMQNESKSLNQENYK